MRPTLIMLTITRTDVNAMAMKNSVHSGRIEREECLRELDLSVTEAAKVPALRIRGSHCRSSSQTNLQVAFADGHRHRLAVGIAESFAMHS